ncbi:MAG: C25 family cysteine peptidase [Bacteroidales bacterium]|nr:C25 family cysteine peptidase [Bacteroidales bacterium]
MKRVFLLLLCFMIYEVYAQQIVTYSFVEHRQIEYEDGFCGLLLENCSYINEEGQPDLPVFGVNILLEPGHEISSIHIQSIEYYPVVENINIRPASAPFPISKGAPDGYKAFPNPDIYNLNKNYPEHIVGEEHTSFLRGYAIGSFLIYPALYNPVQKRAELIKSITLEIYSQATPRAEEALKFLRNDNNTMERIERAASDKNETILNSYNDLCKRNYNNYDILIITKQSFVNGLSSYINHKNKWGYKVLVKTIEEIKTNYVGMDDAEKMRNCVIDAYINDGISYLMLFGDSHPTGSTPHNIIPYRKLYGQVLSSTGLIIDELPSDVYFACLDGTWYNPADNTWGKPGYDDLSHEISVGRICADNMSEIEKFITKLIKYQETPVVADIKKALMVGEKLDDITYGCDYKDQIANGGMYNGYYTAGIPSDYTVFTLYEKNGNWSKAELINRFKTGVHIVNHLGHSAVTYNMKLSNNDITNTNFTNNGVQRSLAIVYSQGCLNGSFDNFNDLGEDVGQDCINEMFHKIDGGVVANIGNSRFGWYSSGNTSGASQRFDRYFFDGIFGQDIYAIGDANSYSKDVNKMSIQSNSAFRWCSYALNLMGDPSMEIWTDVPANFNSQNIKVVKQNDTKISVFTTVPYARIAVLQNNQLLSRGVCNEDGETVLAFDAPFNPASALLSITSHNKYRYEQQGITFMDAPPPIEDLKAEVTDVIKITLKWQTPNLSGGHEPPTAYAIYCDGKKIATVSSDTLSYQDIASSPSTTYEYCVKTLYPGYTSVSVCLPVTTDLYCGAVTQLKAFVDEKKITIYWTVPDFTPKKYTIFRDGEFLKESFAPMISDDVPREYTEYEYCVIANYNGCDSDPTCIKVKSGISCGIIDYITATVDTLSITLSWKYISSNKPIQYVLIRDGYVIKKTKKTSYTDVVPKEGTEYLYCIIAEFENCNTDRICETIKSGGTTDITEQQPELFQIYPNPAYDYITVMGAAMQQIFVYDITGRIVREINPNGAVQSNISVSGLENGLYLLRIHSEGNVLIKRFSVMK